MDPIFFDGSLKLSDLLISCKDVEFTNKAKLTKIEKLTDTSEGQVNKITLEEVERRKFVPKDLVFVTLLPNNEAKGLILAKQGDEMAITTLDKDSETSIRSNLLASGKVEILGGPWEIFVEDKVTKIVAYRSKLPES